MTLRATVFLTLYLTAGLLAFVLPQAGVWGYLFESNYHPPYNRWWGRPLMSVGERWSLYIGAIMILTTLLHWEGAPQARVFSHPQTILLLLFTLNCCVVTLWAYNVEASWKETTDKLKWLAVYICIIRTHSDRRWLPMILYIYLFACIDWGWDTTMDPPGGRRVRGGPVTCGDENFVSAHIVALLPAAGCLILSRETAIWVRIVLALGAPFMLNIVAHAQSRGSFLALIAAAMTVPFVTKGRVRTWAIIGLVLGALVGMRLFHESFWNRMSTIETYQQDGSAEGRLTAWMDAWQLSIRNPFGWGGEAFDKGLRSHDLSTHNMYFESLVAWGFHGTFLWLGFIGVMIWNCRRVMKLTYRPGGVPQSREHLIATGLFVGLVSMLVASMFLNRMRWELWWVFGGLVVCLQNLLPSVRNAGSAPTMYLAWVQPPVPAAPAPARPLQHPVSQET